MKIVTMQQILIHRLLINNKNFKTSNNLYKHVQFPYFLMVRFSYNTQTPNLYIADTTSIWVPMV